MKCIYKDPLSLSLSLSPSLLFVGGICFRTSADWHMMQPTVRATNTWFILSEFTQRNGPTDGPFYRKAWHVLCFFYALHVFSSCKKNPRCLSQKRLPRVKEIASFCLPLPHVNARPWPQPIGDNAWLTLCPSLRDVNLVFLCWPPRSQEKTTVFQMTR